MRGVLAGEEVRDGRRHHPVHDPIQSLEHQNLAAELGKARRDLEADVAAADDDCLGAWPRGRPGSFRVAERAQIEDVSEMLARQPQAARPDAGADHENVVCQLLIGSDDGAPVRQDPIDPGAEAQIDRALGVVGRGADVGALERHLAAHVRLGQGGPLIGRLALLAQEDDLAGKPAWRRLIATCAPACPAPMMTTRSVMADL